MSTDTRASDGAHGNGASHSPRRARREAGCARAQAHDATRFDDEIIEEALSHYLLGRLLDKTQQRADLREEQAPRLAVEVLHAMRRERDAAA